MTSIGSTDDLLRRIEANLERLGGVATPFGKLVMDSGRPYVKKGASPPSLICGVSLRKGLVLARTTVLEMEFTSLEASVPMPMEYLRKHLSERESKYRNRLGFQAVAGFFNPGGWDEASLSYVRNDPPGSGFTHQILHVVLIGPSVTDVVFNTRDKLVVSLWPLFCGHTREEEISIAEAALSKALLVAGYVSIDKVSADTGIVAKIVMEAACRRAAEEGLRLEKVRGAGYVLRRKE